ncbi:amidohydrolase family protein [Pikeienuella piscinae]|uniref:Amidohydrolase family protein n=1 Tax=Pikeienuella piscinae TaxID=2748098 RepID=A0A7L5C477_9RHOB|nr:amidohydrolase family protein [Pikeienuella piscinae]QIE56739.1 amidohydrolase family protein [Pikeienuella piscinae]
MTTLITNAAIVTLDSDDRVILGGELAVEGNGISAIGESGELRARFSEAEVVDASGKLVFPGFANTHTHFQLLIAKGIYEDLSPPHRPPFDGGLAPIPVPDLDPDEMRVICQAAAIEAIRSGTTAVLEDGASIDSYADILADSGLRYLVCERIWDRANAQIGDPRAFEQDRALGARTLQAAADLHTKWHGAADGRIEVGLAAWAPDMCSPDLLRNVRKLQDDLSCVATIHLNQIWGEVAAIQAHRNMLPTEYLDDVGFLSDRLVCAHCRCMDPREEKILGRCNCNVAFNSAIAARRGLSPRVADLEQYGCNIGMGSDNMSEDMVEVVRTGLFMERVRREDGRNPSPEVALRWATVNGYRSLGVADGGSLAPGNKADLILVDTDRAHMVPMLRPASCFVHQGQPSDVDSVMVDGRWVMRDRVILTMNEQDILRRAQDVSESAWKRQFDTRPELPVPSGLSLRRDTGTAT